MLAPVAVDQAAARCPCGQESLGGTVKLANTARVSPSARSARARSAGTRHRIPRDERLASQPPVVTSSQEVPTHPDEILHDAVH